MKRLIALTSAALWASACGGHIKPYEPKRRVYKPPVETPAQTVEKSTQGSLMGDYGGGLVTDVRSFGVGDLVTVRVMERSTAELSASNDLDRNSSVTAGFDFGGGLANIATHNTELNPMKLLQANSRLRHDAEGRTTRRDRIAFTVTAAVRQVLPNGALFIEGNRILKVNDEEHHFYVSGVARPVDIGTDNSVMSSMLAEAEVEFFGSGDLTDNNRQGWFARALSWLWPF